MAEVSPLPIRGEVLIDARGGARAMRVSWHPDHGVVVLSIWRGSRCVGTMQVDSAEVPHLVDVLGRGLAASAAPTPPLEDAG
jgi:hypothetical protein